MKGSGAVLFLSCLLSVKAQVMHSDVYLSGCSDSDGVVMRGLDGEEMWYGDFTHNGVVTLPSFADPIDFSVWSEILIGRLQICRANLATFRRGYKNPTITQDAPHSTIYTRDEVQLGVENTVICHVTEFYPAPVRVSWTRNGENVTEGVSISVPYCNKDNTFNQVSRLLFTPEEGDIYSCSVEHNTLTEPQTRMWDVEVSQPSVGPAVFCGVGLTLGLLGVAAGTFFLIKGNECN